MAADADTGSIVMVPALKRDEALKKAVEAARWEFMLERRYKRAVFSYPDLFYIPYYFVDVSLRAHYRATVRLTYSRTVYTERGRITEDVTEDVSVSGEVSYADTVPVLARRAAGGIAAAELARHYLSTRPEAVPLDRGVDYSIAKAFMAAEFGRERAKAVALREAAGKLLKRVDEDAMARAERAVGHRVYTVALLDKTVEDVNVDKADVSPLTYLPAWLVPYVLDESQYSFAVAGWDGAVIAKVKPMFVEDRLAYAVGAALAAGLLGGFGGAELQHCLALGDVVPALLCSILFGGIPLFFGLLAAFFLGALATEEFEVTT